MDAADMNNNEIEEMEEEFHQAEADGTDNDNTVSTDSLDAFEITDICNDTQVEKMSEYGRGYSIWDVYVIIANFLKKLKVYTRFVKENKEIYKNMPWKNKKEIRLNLLS